MSTAGKVLVVLVMLTSLVWMVLSAGVSQLNTNGNKKLHDLAEQIEKLQDRFQADSRRRSLRSRDQTSSVQENLDHEITVLRARQSDLEKARSQIRESLSRFNTSSRPSRKRSSGRRRHSSIVSTNKQTERAGPGQDEIGSQRADGQELASS